MTEPFIRQATTADIARLPEIERDAAQAFLSTDLAMGPIIKDVNPAETWRAPQAQGTLWVMDDGEGRPVGFIAAEVMGDVLHLHELDILSAWQGRGLGRRLMRHALDWARQAGLVQATLTTFRDIPWNGPFYASMGFIEPSPNQRPARLTALLEQEAARGLDAARRCAMVLRL